MPDRYGFNHLGDQVRCIDCPSGGPLGAWPERRRAVHARTTHQRSTDVWRQRILLAAPPTDPEEEKEAIMATTPAKAKGEPAKQVAIDILRKAGGPLHAKEIASRVLASGRCAGLKGKTPVATISAMLAVGSKPGGPFARVRKGTYTLAEAAGAASSAKPAAKPAATKPTRTRKTAQTQKPSGWTRTKRSPAKRAGRR